MKTHWKISLDLLISKSTDGLTDLINLFVIRINPFSSIVNTHFEITFTIYLRARFHFFIFVHQISRPAHLIKLIIISVV